MFRWKSNIFNSRSVKHNNKRHPYHHGKNYRNFTSEKLCPLSGLEIIRSSYIETTIGWFWERAVKTRAFDPVSLYNSMETRRIFFFMSFWSKNYILWMYEHYLQIVKKKHHCHKKIRLFFPNLYEVTVVIRPHQQTLNYFTEISSSRSTC